nr:retrovirus-related Pol polyprotein from transposon TNT 1-94 [Tanacetum cinerariifolium]
MIGLLYLKGTAIEIVVYADSDHARDYVDRKSTSGVCTFLGCCLTSWFSKKQTPLAVFTIEAEYVAFYLGLRLAPEDLAFCLRRPFVLSQKILCFVFRRSCVLSSEDLAFCLQKILSFVFRRSCVLSSEHLAFCLQRSCVLLGKHCALSSKNIAFCLWKHCVLPNSRILRFVPEALRFA